MQEVGNTASMNTDKENRKLTKGTFILLKGKQI